MILENSEYYIYCNYHGDIKELQTQLSRKNVTLEKECHKYFCNYCLRTSYQTNTEAASTVQDSGLPKEKKQIMLSKQLKVPINNNPTNLKHASITKDWCCPWCINICFCSRCLRADQIFSLAAIYVHYNGHLTDLKDYLKKSSSILEALYEYLIPNKIVIKDGMNIVRQNKVYPKYKYKGKDDQESHIKEESIKSEDKLLHENKDTFLKFKLDSDRVFSYNYEDHKLLDQRIDSKMNELDNKTRSSSLIKRGRGRPKKSRKDDDYQNELSHSLKLLGKKREKESVEEVKKKMLGKELKLFNQLQRFKPYDIVVQPSSPKSSYKNIGLIKSLLIKIRSLKKRRGRPPGSKNNFSSQESQTAPTS